MAWPAAAAGDEAAPAAPKPLYRDPVQDGAADPVVVWNPRVGKWWMFYTNRRAKRTEPGEKGVAWVHGTRIGIAESGDGGVTWSYAGIACIDGGHGAKESHWAPEVIGHKGTWHMYLTVVPGTFADWNHPRAIVHFTSKDLREWTKRSELKLSSDRVIDACVARMPDGKWRMWYNNEVDRKSIYQAESDDLFAWRDLGKAVGEQSGEGPKVVRWKDRWWMVVDHWQGLGLYASDDATRWQRQAGNLLQAPGRGVDDGVMGGHADLVVNDGRAYLFYFTHPGRRGPDAKRDGYKQRRSSIQVVELLEHEGKITCDRDAPCRIRLVPP